MSGSAVIIGASGGIGGAVADRLVALHPGTVDTDLSKPFQRNVAADKLFTPARAALQLIDVVNQLSPLQSGRLIGWDGSEIAP